MKPIITRHCERIELRTARKDRECSTWAERDGAEEPQCTRVIAAGEKYLASTIYPGHDSGYADAGSVRRLRWNDTAKRFDWFRVAVPARPVTSAFCLPCADRWTSLRDALSEITQEAS